VVAKLKCETLLIPKSAVGHDLEPVPLALTFMSYCIVYQHQSLMLFCFLSFASLAFTVAVLYKFIVVNVSMFAVSYPVLLFFKGVSACFLTAGQVESATCLYIKKD
jgi:hypothetical protein